MKFIPLFLLFSYAFFAQEKTKIIYSKETVYINVNRDINIETLTQEKKHIPKSKEYEDYTVRIPYDNFNEITEIKGHTLLLKNQKKISLNSAYVTTNEINREDVFHSDYKFKHFIFPSVEDNSDVEYSYRNKYKEPRLVSQFNFQNQFQTETSTFQIICDSKAEIGFKIFGENQEKIIFTTAVIGDKKIYTWEAKDLEPFQNEKNMSSKFKYLPHIIYFVKSYQKNGEKVELLNTTKNLYQWYVSLTKNINNKDQTDLINKTNELIKGQRTDLEKAKSIFQWVQKNLHYVAFEFEMGGFIPRDASDVFYKKYGDCKDMANLTNEMFKHAGIKSNLTWIGTRQKPYTYEELSTPMVDNHMIASAILDGKRYYFDATDRYCEFLYPSQMIQDKEALIGISEEEFLIEKVPIVASEKNKIKINLDLSLNENTITGTINSEMFGFNKSDLLNQLSVYNSKEQELWKNFIIESNPKINLEIIAAKRNEYSDLPTQLNYKVSVSDWTKNSNGKILFKPVLIYPFNDSMIDSEKRKVGLDLRNTSLHEITYNYSIPKDYKIEFLPENYVFENNLGKIELKYAFETGIVKVTQTITIKAIDFEKKEFQNWNDFIKKLNKNYNQSIIFVK